MKRQVIHLNRALFIGCRSHLFVCKALQLKLQHDVFEIGTPFLGEGWLSCHPAPLATSADVGVPEVQLPPEWPPKQLGTIITINTVSRGREEAEL